MFFHHNSIRKYTTAILDVFSDLEVPRYDESGNLLKALNVPIVFSSRERAVQYIEQDYTNNNAEQNILPKMALSLNGMTKAQQRDTNKAKKINLKQTEDMKSTSFQLNSVSYDFSYTLHIMTRTMTDLTMIVEQILPQFRPTLNIKIKELDFVDEYITIPIDMEGVSYDFPVDFGDDDDIRILTADIELNMRGRLHLPVKDTTIIKHVDALLTDPDIGDISHTTYDAFDDDTITYNKEDDY